MKPNFFKQAIETSILYNFMAAMEQGCSRCTLSDHNHKPIVYRGNPEADILLVGEAPGKVEQQEGKPFVGPAGKMLDNIMSAIGLDTQKDLCITNTVYCRPTAPSSLGKQNYTPKQEQLAICWPFMSNFIRVIRPKVIIACGRTALAQLIDDDNVRIGPHEGKWLDYKQRYKIRIPSLEHMDAVDTIPVFVMTHPAAILHKAPWPEEQAAMKKKVWEYMQHFRDTWKEKADDQ